ncbi:transposase [Streptosporangium carneum]|uniref:Transposase n=1 Tax=Streptosporangium carneum TaxID=47481 RepID=A0A9W6MAL5_9ACTN|nr:transposase [Streptosporangium carneum]GLK07181.1 hypothetical protein GCM10017600_05860 [Streptosporangium carneum]
MAETRRGFDPESRAGAVRIVRETGDPIAQVAREMGVNANTLSDWTRAGPDPVSTLEKVPPVSGPPWSRRNPA